MAKPSKTQWDFGELFPVETTRPEEAVSVPPQPFRRVLTVGELTTEVRRLIEKGIGQVWVTGEITNFRSQSSGHLYFTLKDAESQLSCVLFRNEAPERRAFLQDGRKVVLQGDLTVYEPRGQYQLRVTVVELQGVGALQAAFERLKQKLNAEGLFAPQRKRPLPRYPQRIGIVTSPSGAAIRDVLHVVQRRNPALEMILASARVQGQGAAEEIAAAIRLLNMSHATGYTSLDLILVTRGGGSLEDLWAFNEEIVARAIYESRLPVVSAVGHEIDFTISDFVADLRAATPSAAAEIITEGVFSSFQFIAGISGRLQMLARQLLAERRDSLDQLQYRLRRVHPRVEINEWLQLLDDLQSSLSRCARNGTRAQRIAWQNLRSRLARVRPVQLLAAHQESLDEQGRRLRAFAQQQLREKRHHLAGLQTRLGLLGPEQVLARGYSITMRADTGQIIRAADEIKPGQKLRTRVKSGEIRSVAED